MPDRMIPDALPKSTTASKLSLLAYFAWPWMSLACDNWGRFVYNPRLVCAALTPLRGDITDVQMGALLEEFRTAGLIQVYKSDRTEYAAVPLEKWDKWQPYARRWRKRPSRIPDPPGFATVAPVDSEQPPAAKVVSSRLPPELLAAAQRLWPMPAPKHLSKLTLWMYGEDKFPMAWIIAAIDKTVAEADRKKHHEGFVKAILDRFRLQGGVDGERSASATPSRSKPLEVPAWAQEDVL